MRHLFLPLIAMLGVATPTSAPAQQARELTPIVFFIAKGKADACGPGCDTWIAAHGDFDLASAARFETFLKRVGKRNLPIFFHSAGGSWTRAMAVGKQIRARKMTVNVGYTVPLDCGGNANSAKCRKDVNSSRELESILSNGGLCSSACIPALIGGSRREISEAARLQIHSYRFFTTQGGKHGTATPAGRAARATEKFDIEAERYIADMGVSRELFAAIRSVPFEQMRTLTREEIVRFGIDTRSTVAR